MGLLDDLIAASASLDPSLQPATSQLAPILGALVHYEEHGDKFLKAAAAGPEAVSSLLAGEPPAEPAGKDAGKGKG